MGVGDFSPGSKVAGSKVAAFLLVCFDWGVVAAASGLGADFFVVPPFGLVAFGLGAGFLTRGVCTDAVVGQGKGCERALGIETMAFSEGGVTVTGCSWAFGGEFLDEAVETTTTSSFCVPSQTASMSSRVLLPCPSSFCCLRKSINVA